jgi:hypothetical protein
MNRKLFGLSLSLFLSIVLMNNSNPQVGGGGISAGISSYTQLPTIPSGTVLGNSSGLQAAPSAQSTAPFPLTAFTASGCSNGTLIGGYTQLTPYLWIATGSLVVGASGTCVLILTFGSATHFWNCNGAGDITSQITFVQTAHTQTTSTISGAASTSDIVTFVCMGV